VATFFFYWTFVSFSPISQMIGLFSLHSIHSTYFLPSKLCVTYSYVHSQSQNNRKIHVNFANQPFKTWQEVTSYLPCRFLLCEQ
jgi:hypothetical protein